MPTVRPYVTHESLRRLATLRGHPAVTSVYLDVDGGHRPVTATYRQAFEQLADDVRRRARAQDDRRTLRSVESDLDAMRAWLGHDVDRSTTRGVALFGCHEQAWFEAIELPVAVRDQAGIGPAPLVRQLVEVSDEPEPCLVALVDHTRLRLFRIHGHEIDELPELVTQQERAVDTSGELGSFERHDQEAGRMHLRRAADALDDALRTWPVRQVMLGGPDAAVAELERFVHATTRDLIVGRVSVRVGAATAEIESAARVVADLAERRRQADLVEEVRQRTAGAHGAVIGLEATLAALAEQRVATLLIRTGFAAPGGWCPQCRRIGPDLRQCPVCGTTNDEIEDAVEVAVEQAVAQNADVEFCHDTDLERFGSIAAIERY